MIIRTQVLIPFVLLATAGCDRGGAEDVLPQQEAAKVADVTRAATPGDARTKPVVHVWKAPACDCCHGWVEHLRAAGYPVEVEDVLDVAAIKREEGIPNELHACHTALVDGYLVEGHVPADVVARMLTERPRVAGIAAPGMPVGSPGMEVPGMPAQPYEIFTFTAQGETSVYDRR